MTLLLASAVDVALVVGLALCAAALLRRRSAALRHAVIGAAILIAAVMPAFEVLVPAWPLPLTWAQPAGEVELSRTFGSLPLPEAPPAAAPASDSPLRSAWPMAAGAAWLIGVVVVLAGLLTGFVRLARVTRHCTHVRTGPWRDQADRTAEAFGIRQPIALLQSAHPALLVTCGLFRPKIILPAGAERWTDERRRVVLAHEIAHIRRGDWAVQLAAEALRAAYWFNPLVWIACRRLRHESEYACDDAVLNCGVGATDYAAHLLDVARHAVGQHAPLVAAPAIAHPSTLERRISAMLIHQRNREPLTRRAWGVAVAGALAIAVPIAAVGIAPAEHTPVLVVAPADDVPLAPGDAPAGPPAAPTARSGRLQPDRFSNAAAARAQQEPASFSGTLYDQSGAVLPGAEVALTDTAVGLRRTEVTDPAGRFRFAELAPAEYEFTARLPGFTTVSNVMPLAAGADVVRSITLPIGSLHETITVGCSAPAAALGTVVQNVKATLPPNPIPGSPRVWRRPKPAPEPPQAAAQDQIATGAVRVGGQLKVPRLRSRVNPICPRNVIPTSDVVIRLAGRVGIDGYMVEVRHVPDPDSAPPLVEFVDSAMDAVRQWNYTPTLLNNQPVDVNVTYTIVYTRM